MCPASIAYPLLLEENSGESPARPRMPASAAKSSAEGAARRRAHGDRKGERLPFGEALSIPGYLGPLVATDLSSRDVGFVASEPIRVGKIVSLVFFGRNVVVDAVVKRACQVEPAKWHLGAEFLQPQGELLAVALSLYGLAERPS